MAQTAPPIDASTPAGMTLLKAEIDAGQAKIASLTPAQRAQRERYYTRLNAELDRRTAAKRRRGFRPGEPVDFSTEWQAASRAAVVAVKPGTAGRAIRNREHRPAARRRSSSSSRTSSTDPGSGDSDPAGPPAAPPWRRYVVDSRYCVVELVAAS